MGEAHNAIGRCKETYCEEKGTGCNFYEVHQWLGDLSKNAPECLDIFLETEYLYASNEEQIGGSPLKNFNNGIAAIKDEFKDCLTNIAKNKDRCYSDHLRFHYIDVRKYQDK